MPHINQKRWISVCGLGAVVATSIAAAAMTGSCVFGTTTNLCEQSGLRCQEGQECAAQQMACIDIGGCGDGITDRDKGEVCDDGNILDGQMTDGKFVVDDCSHDCKSDQRCGNSIVDTGETCDHGPLNGQPEDLCDDHCQLRDKMCGNEAVDMDAGEQCDPGEMDSAGCNSRRANDPANLFDSSPSAGCKFSRCGDGYVNAAAMEKCDSGGMITMDCNGPLCTKPVCGDNFHNAAAGEDCDNGQADTPGCNGDQGGRQSCKFPACGDGYANTAFKPSGSKHTETCDTGGDSSSCNGGGNDSRDNDPDAECQPPSCGDGYTNTKFTPGNGATATEQCDNKGGGNTAACNGNNGGMDGLGSCRKPACGDGYKNIAFTPPGDLANPEQCDTGGNTQSCNGNDNDNDNAKGQGDCQIPSCGDGYKNPAFTPPGDLAKPEQCDTGGNTQSCNGNNNDNSQDKGLGDCQIPSCGDGYVNGAFIPPGSKLPEQCDHLGGVDTPSCNGNNSSNNGPGSCRFNKCGDGYKNTAAGEECDNGDLDKVPEIKCPLSSQQCKNCHCI